MGRVWGMSAALIGMALLAACGTERQPSARNDDDTSEISAAQLNDAFEDPATAEFLSPEERTALDRVRGEHAAQVMDHAAQSAPPPEGAVARALDDVGKVGVALLSVAATIGVLIAPLFLF